MACQGEGYGGRLSLFDLIEHPARDDLTDKRTRADSLPKS